MFVVRNQTPLVPSQPAFDVTVYIVLNDFGPLGNAYCETDETDADEETIVENILRGQYSRPRSTLPKAWARDVTEDIARAVLSRASTERRSIGVAAQDFLVRVLGADVTNG